MVSRIRRCDHCPRRTDHRVQKTAPLQLRIQPLRQCRSNHVVSQHQPLTLSYRNHTIISLQQQISGPLPSLPLLRLMKLNQTLPIKTVCILRKHRLQLLHHQCSHGTSPGSIQMRVIGPGQQHRLKRPKCFCPHLLTLPDAGSMQVNQGSLSFGSDRLCRRRIFRQSRLNPPVRRPATTRQRCYQHRQCPRFTSLGDVPPQMLTICTVRCRLPLRPLPWLIIMPELNQYHPRSTLNTPVPPALRSKTARAAAAASQIGAARLRRQQFPKSSTPAGFIRNGRITRQHKQH